MTGSNCRTHGKKAMSIRILAVFNSVLPPEQCYRFCEEHCSSANVIDRSKPRDPVVMRVMRFKTQGNLEIHQRLICHA